MNGKDIEPDKDICSHLILMLKPRTGKVEWICVCEEEAAAGCIKDGGCPIYPEMTKMIKELCQTR